MRFRTGRSCFSFVFSAVSVSVRSTSTLTSEHQSNLIYFTSHKQITTTTMTDSRNTLQDFQTTSQQKMKRNSTTTQSAATISFLSPNQFAALSENESEPEVNGAPPPPHPQTTRIPPIVVDSYLNNHLSTLKKGNEKLTAPVEVKSKMNRLLLYTKSFPDYNIFLTEIRAANLAYHTYPLLEAIQPHLVLKGIQTNVPEEDVQGELAAHDIQTVKVTQLTKTDKLTRTIINKYPIFVITFQPGTEILKVLQLRNLCHCIIR